MRSVKQTSAFKRDLKKESKGSGWQATNQELYDVVALLASDTQLPENYKDHALTGNWKGYRECHIRPDLLLVYFKRSSDILYLARLGSHSEIF